jgi:LPXTG-motif cell wall-anchored protein
VQAEGTTCVTESPLVDACPDALNPGVQKTGTICAVAPPATQTPVDTNPPATGGGAVETPAAETPAAETPAAETPAAETPAAEETPEVDATDDAPATTPVVAASATTPRGNLPYTGAEQHLAALLGMTLLMLGTGLHVLAGRKARQGN